METPNNTNPTIKIEAWPRVKVGAQSLEVKWGFFPRFLLSQWGIRLDDNLNAMRDLTLVSPEVKNEAGEVTSPARWRTGTGYEARTMEIFAACVGHNYTQIGQPAPTAAYWAAQVEGDQQWVDIITAIMAAMGKDQAAKKAKEEAQAPLPKSPEPTPTTPTLQ